MYVYYCTYVLPVHTKYIVGNKLNYKIKINN